MANLSSHYVMERTPVVEATLVQSGGGFVCIFRTEYGDILAFETTEAWARMSTVLVDLEEGRVGWHITFTRP